MSVPTPADRWRHLLDGWAIPDEIAAAAPAPPWHLPPACFTPHANPPSRSTTTASLAVLERAGPGATVLDVGCGAGRSSLHLVPPAASVVGVDSSPAMLDRFRAEAAAAGVPATAIEGRWPDADEAVPTADLVVCTQVVYNAPDIEPFVEALVDHARVGVVVEIDAVHPAAKLSEAWQHFWNLERPDGPRVEDFLAVLAALGIEPTVMRSTIADHKSEIGTGDVERARTRLCLPPERDEEVRRLLEAQPRPARRLATMSWLVDV